MLGATTEEKMKQTTTNISVDQDVVFQDICHMIYAEKL